MTLSIAPPLCPCRAYVRVRWESCLRSERKEKWGPPKNNKTNPFPRNLLADKLVQRLFWIGERADNRLSVQERLCTARRSPRLCVVYVPVHHAAPHSQCVVYVPVHHACLRKEPILEH